MFTFVFSSLEYFSFFVAYIFLYILCIINGNISLLHPLIDALVYITDQNSSYIMGQLKPPA